MNFWKFAIILLPLLSAPVTAQDLELYKQQLAECDAGTKPFSCALYAQILEAQARAGGDTNLNDEAKCLRSREHSLVQMKKQCPSDDTSSAVCADFSQHLSSDLSVDECVKLARGGTIDIGVLTSSAPGCKGQIDVDARKDSWQWAFSLEPGQIGQLYVPIFHGYGPQEWLVIDHGHQEANDILGNGVKAGSGFAAPGLPEGALLFKGGDSAIKMFNKPVGSAIISTPGDVSFLANDTQGVNDTHVLHIGFHGNGYDDNGGSIKVNWVKQPCPLPHKIIKKPPPFQDKGAVWIDANGPCDPIGNQMVLHNTKDHAISALIRQDVNGIGNDIEIVLASNQSFPLGCSVGAAASQYTWTLLSIK